MSAQSIKDISSSILKETEGKIIEYGLRYELTISEEPEKSCKEIFNLLSKKKEDLLVSNGTGGNKFSIEFHDEKSRAFIGYSQENKKITVEFVEEGDLETMVLKKREMDEYLKKKPWKVVKYEYLKAKTREEDLVKVKGQIEDILKAFGADNIASVNIQKGYSITAYTGIGNSMKNGNELIDINCAIRSCESGTYVIIGTPVISTSY